MTTGIYNYDELDYNIPTRDGESSLYRYFIKEAEETVSIPHLLNRIPRRVFIVWADNPIMQPEIVKLDRQKAILIFFESYTNIVLKFE